MSRISKIAAAGFIFVAMGGMHASAVKPGDHFISSESAEPIGKQEYLYDTLKVLALTPEQVSEFIEAYKDGETKQSVIKLAKKQAESNVTSEEEQANRTLSAIDAAEGESTPAKFDAAEVELAKLKFTDTKSMRERLDKVKATIESAEKKAREDAEAKSRAEEERKQKEADEAAKRERAKNSEAKQFSDGRAAFDQIADDYGLSAEEKQMWEYIIVRESGFDPYATNPSSGAYGIPQALPGGKMASAGADWQTNPYTQLKWMYSYMEWRYGSISGAYTFWQANHWY